MVERALEAFLEAHEPCPALLLRDGAWIEKGNRGAARLWSGVRGESADAALPVGPARAPRA
jgi:hypothetical protein